MDRIVILDMGGQYAHLLTRRIRQLGVYAEILPCDTDVSNMADVKGIILSGGPSSVYGECAPQPHQNLFSQPIPILGLCYGHHLMAHHLGGKVDPGDVKEYGFAQLKIKDKEGLLEGLDSEEQVWMSHGDEVKALPEGFVGIANTIDCPLAAMADKTRQYFGLQFHPEVTHTPHGMAMLENFVEITKANRDYDVSSYLKGIRQEIMEQAKTKKVFLLVSGGVDSTVCYALLERVLGPENVLGLFIDNGLVRKHEASKVKDSLAKLGFKNFKVYDASEEFLENLNEVYDPEQKRIIIGETFIDVQQKVLREFGLNSEEWILAQGTIYPDTIETKGTKHADLIKTHHNRVPLVQEMIDKGLVMEPLKGLYKDEVRELGEELGLPKDIVWRHPFPGPGLGVRALCIDKPTFPTENETREVDDFAEEIGHALTMLPVKSVGVQGDARTYRHPVVLDHPIDYVRLTGLSTEITNKLVAVNRVLLQLGGEKSEKLIPRSAYLTKPRLDLLRDADDIVMDLLRRHSLYDKIWQFPVVLLPLGKDGESIILRPVTSQEAMTARFGEIDETVLLEMVDSLLSLEGIDAVFLDITNKPPGTIEWE